MYGLQILFVGRDNYFFYENPCESAVADAGR